MAEQFEGCRRSGDPNPRSRSGSGSMSPLDADILLRCADRRARCCPATAQRQLRRDVRDGLGESFYPEERPVHRVSVDGFWMDDHPVTAAEYRRSCARRSTSPSPSGRSTPSSTRTPIPTCSSRVARLPGHRRAGEPRRLPQLVGVRPRRLLEAAGRKEPNHQRPRQPPGHPRRLRGRRRRTRPGSARSSRPRPRESQRGGFEGAAFARGDEHIPDGKPMANTWQGEFPWQNLKLDGYERTSPVGSLRRMATGSTTSRGTSGSGRPTGTCLPSRRGREPVLRPSNPRVSAPTRATTPVSPVEHIPRRDQGRLAPLRAQLLPPLPPAARQPQMIDTSMSHLGFRCIVHRPPRGKERPDGRQAEHPRDLGRRHRHHQPQLLQRRADGLPHAEHRPDRQRGDALTDSYGEQSCTVGRSAFITGQSVFRTGLSKVGMPVRGRVPGRVDPTIAELLKNHGYSTGQFGKNHLGDRTSTCRPCTASTSSSEPLPPERRGGLRVDLDYPGRHGFEGSRSGSAHAACCGAGRDGKDDPKEHPRWGRVGKQRIQDTGPLTGSGWRRATTSSSTPLPTSSSASTTGASRSSAG